MTGRSGRSCSPFTRRRADQGRRSDLKSSEILSAAAGSDGPLGSAGTLNEDRRSHVGDLQSASTLPLGSKDPTKARKAAADPARPGEKCLASPGIWAPMIDRARCEGKEDCVAVCPYSVFELGTLTDREFNSLGFVGRLKARSHDRRTARTPNAGSCRACGLCVVACPEEAISLQRAGSFGLTSRR
jgi:4Fe-4S ferredoxin